jgi:hypothetical protein
MNLLTLKTIVYNPAMDTFHSPTRQSFTWTREITARQCPRCNVDYLNPGCTCGIYASPNPRTLIEYTTSRNSVFAVLNTFGWVDIWTAPDDVGPGLITRSWGAQIIGVVSTELNGEPLAPQRQLCSVKLAENMEVDMWPWNMAKWLIKATWNQSYMIIKDPYDPEQYVNL